MKTVSFSQNVPVVGKYDVLIAGGGVAGVAAALTVCREGKKVLLIEKSNILGGLATLGRVNYFEPMCNGCGRQIIKGMANELLQLALKYGYDTLHPEWKNGEPKEPTRLHYNTLFSPYIFALCLTEALKNEGADILFDTVVTAPIMDGKIIRGVIVDNKSGLQCYEAKQFIDVTGDGDLLVRCGIPTVQGENYFSFFGTKITLDSCKAAVEQQNIRAAYTGVAGGIAALTGKGHPEGMPTFPGTTAENINDFIIQNQLVMLDRLKGDDRMSRDVAAIPLMPQLRTTRHIDGMHTLTTDDLFCHFADSIGVMGDPQNRGHLYEIPFGTICHPDAPNLLTAGRSAAAEGHGWYLLRIIPPAIVTGQAAGFAACQALAGDRAVYEPDIPALQQSILSAGNIVHFEDSWKKDIEKIQ